MAKKSQEKGARGEREVIALLNGACGTALERSPYRQRIAVGHHDAEGCDWMSLEVKRYKTATQSQVESWWAETYMQSNRYKGDRVPLLAYRADRSDWRFVLPVLFVANGFGAWPGDLGSHNFDRAELTIVGLARTFRRVIDDALR